MKQPRGSAGGDLLFFIFFLVVLGVVWALTGGPGRAISHAGPFLNPPFPLGNGSAYTVPHVGGSTGSSTQTSSNKKLTFADIIANLRLGGSGSTPSSYASSVTLMRGNTVATNPSQEYLVLRTSNKSPTLSISNWQVESVVSGTKVALGPAEALPISGDQNSETSVTIGPNTTVYIVTGHSPTGYSFRENACSGYFSQSQTFTPSLGRSCPRPNDELTRAAQAGFIPNDACISYVGKINTCTLHTGSYPTGLGDQCINFISTTLTYNGCANAHRSDTDFYKNTWYIYLDRDQELWKSANDQIRLLDDSGNVVATVSY